MAKVRKITEDDKVQASKMEFIWTMAKFEAYIVEKNIKQKKEMEHIINGKVVLNDMLANEKIKYHDYGSRRVEYRDVWLLDTS